MLRVLTWLPVPVAFTSIVEETAIGEKPLPSGWLTPSCANTGENPPGWLVHKFKDQKPLLKEPLSASVYQMNPFGVMTCVGENPLACVGSEPRSSPAGVAGTAGLRR